MFPLNQQNMFCNWQKTWLFWSTWANTATGSWCCACSHTGTVPAWAGKQSSAVPVTICVFRKRHDWKFKKKYLINFTDKITETKIFLSPSHASDLTIKIHQWRCGGCEMVDWKRAQLYLGPCTINWSLDVLQDFKRGSDCAKGKLVWILCMISWSWHDFYFFLKGKYEIIAIVNTTWYIQSKSYKSQ